MGAAQEQVDSGVSIEKKRRLAGWRILVLVFAGIAALALADWRIALAPHQGHVPEDCSVVAFAPNPRVFWNGVANSRAVERLAEELPRPLWKLELEIRESTGIRPTPLRWRVWLGYRTMLGVSPDGAGISTHPGLLLRAVHKARSVFVKPDDRGIFTYRDLYYAWRGGFLIASRSKEYVAKAVAAEPTETITHFAFAESNEALLLWRHAPRGFVVVRGDDPLPVRGEVESFITGASAPMTLAEAWPEPPMLSLTCARWEDAATIAKALTQPLNHFSAWSSALEAARLVWREWDLGAFPNTWDPAITHLSIGVTEIDEDGAIPVPVVAMLWRAERSIGRQHPLAPLADAAGLSIPFEWHRSPGLLVPLMGPQVSLCLGRSGRDWIATTNERTMDALVGSLQDVEARDTNTVAVLQADWERLGLWAERFLMQVSDLEVFPGMDRDDVAHEVSPVARGIARLGSLRLSLGHMKDALWIEGHLAHD